MQKLVLLFLLAVVWTSTALSQTNSSYFSHEQHADGGYIIPYRLLSPPTASTEKPPLVIFLHGADERGNNNQKQLENGAESFLRRFAGDYSAYVIAPQCPNWDYWSNAISIDYKGGYQFNFTTDTPTPVMKALMSLINSWIASGKIDTNRIYVGGISMGGFGTYELLWRMPNTFAAAFPICGGTDTRNGKLDSYASKTPVWMFHGNADKTVSVNYSRDAYTKLQQIKGSIIKYTEYPGVGHSSWWNAFAEKELIPWIFGYRNIETAYYRISSPNTDATITKDYSSLSLSKFNNNSNQSWLITKVTNLSPSSYTIQTTDGSNLYLSTYGYGESLTLSSSATNSNQYWKLVETEKGLFSIVSEANNYKLEINNNGLRLTGSNTNNINQKWKIAHSKMYIIGGATPGEWKLNSVLEMEVKTDENAVFTWSGFLKNSDFKFQSTKFTSWESSYTAITANRYPVYGEKQKLIVHPPTQYDFKFKLNQVGFYNIRVDMANRDMTVTPVGASNIYIVGSATPAGWNPNIAEPMTNQNSGIFKWEGYLKTGEFKFILNRGFWDPSVNAFGQQNVTPGRVVNLNITNGAQNDYKFNIPNEGYYTVTVDTYNWTMVVDAKTSGIPLYIVGGATPIGWDNYRAMPLQLQSDNTYTWEGYLKADHFKFITKLGTWSSILPAKARHEPIVTGYTHDISSDYKGDYRFVVAEAGYYSIKVDLPNQSMVVKKSPTNLPVYIIGDATPVQWDNRRASPMTATSDEEYIWNGYLRPGHLKFITQLGTWNSIIPTNSNEYITLGYTHRITNYNQSDTRFIVSSSAGYYSVTLNVKNKTLRIDRDYLRSAVNEEPQSPTAGFIATPLLGMIKIDNTSNQTINTARLLNMNGSVLDMTENKDGTFYLGSNLPQGVYIIDILQNNQKHTQKVKIK